MKRNLIITFLSLLLAAVTIASLLFTPPAAQNRLRPIPAYAQLVYNNQNPDWFLSFFPSVFAGGFAATEMDGEILKPSAMGSKPWNFFFQGSEKNSKPQRSEFQGFIPKVHPEGLRKSPLAVATVPFNGRAGRDAWVAVSELGGPTALLFRWRLLLFPPEGISSARSYAAWPVWKLDHPSLPAWARVRFTLTDGLLICSISDDSHDIYKLLDTLDGRAASLANPRKL